MSVEGRLVWHGDDLALVLDPEILKQMNIGPDTKLELLATEDSLVVTVQDEKHREKLRALIREMNEQYGEVFKRLAE